MTARLVLALVVLAAALASGALGPRYGGTLRVGVLELPGSLEATASAGDGGRILAGLVSETLVGLDAEGAPVPGLARTWLPSASAREWTLELSENPTSHDGQPVRAADALRSLRRFLRSPSAAADRLARSLEGGPAFRARQTEELPGLAAPGEARLVLRFDGTIARPIAPLASPLAAPTSESGKGAGPFVPGVLVPGRRAAFTPFAGHVRGRPYLDELEVLAVGDWEALRAALQSGRIDVALTEADASAHSLLLLSIDPERDPFRSREARALVAGAIDRVELVRRLVPGGHARASLLDPIPVPPVSAPAGSPPGTLSGRVTLLVGRDVPPLVSQRVVAHLLDLGLSVDAVAGKAAERRPGRAELRLFLFLPEVAESGLALEEMAGLVPPVPAVREALEAAWKEPDDDRRRALLRKAEEALLAEAVLVPVAGFPLAPAAAAGVRGLRVDRTGRLVLEDTWREP